MKFKFVCIVVLVCIFVNMSVVFASNDTNIDTDIGNSLGNAVDDVVDTMESNVKEVKGNSFKDIQDVVDSADDNDVIILNGTYYGHSLSDQIFVNKSITIEGKNNATLNAGGWSRIFYINADNVVLKNLEITGGSKYTYYHDDYLDSKHDTFGGAIYWRGNNGTLMDCYVWGNKIIEGQYGAIYWPGHDGRIINSHFNYNDAHGPNVVPEYVVSGTIRGVLNGSLYHYFELKDDYLTFAHSYDRWDSCLVKDAWVNSDFSLVVTNVSVYSNVGNVKIKFKLSYKDVPFYNENITVFAFGRNFTLVSDEMGEAYLNVPNGLLGEYVINSIYDNRSINSTLNIMDLPCILSADKINFYYNNNNEYYVKITSLNSQYLGNIGVSLKIGNKVLYGVSDNKGFVKFNIPKLNSGKYDVEMNVLKNGTSDVFKSYINIKKINAKVKHSLKHKKLKISIVNKVTKMPLSNIKILVKVTNPKKKFKKTFATNKKGKVSFKLKKGKNKIKIKSINNNYNVKYKIKKIKV